MKRACETNSHINRKKIWNLMEGEDPVQGNLSYSTVGKILGISAARVHQIERKALWKLRHSILAQYWRDYKSSL